MAAAADASWGQKLIGAFRNDVWAYLAPRLDEMTGPEIQEETHKLAETHFQGREDVLSQEADRLLGRLPEVESLDRWQWVSRLTESDREKVHAFLEHGKKTLGWPSLPQSWDPIALARSIRGVGVCLGTNELPKDFSVELMTAQAVFRRMESVYWIDPDHPVILERTGNKITAVYFERSAEGRYVPADFDVLVRAGHARAE